MNDNGDEQLTLWQQTMQGKGEQRWGGLKGQQDAGWRIDRRSPLTSSERIKVG